MKVLLILVDGMRPDALVNVSRAQEMIKKSSSTMNASTVIPPVTLPCHMSLFHSVDPERHGTTTNTYAPQVRPINGLCEQIRFAGKKNAFFYNWEELRDLARPGSLLISSYHSEDYEGFEISNENVTDEAIKYIPEFSPDFAFVYLGMVDVVGHGHGWMSDEYMASVEKSWEEIDRIVDILDDDWTVIITADHGGHGRGHGEDIPEDMTIPLIIKGKDFAPGSHIENASIKDIAPTVVDLLGVEPAKEWEGRSLRK